MIRFHTPVLATTMLLSSMAVHAAIPSGDRAALTASINAGDGPAVTLSVNRILSSSLDKRDGPAPETLASTLGDAGYRDALINGAVGADATRQTAEEIEEFI